MQGQTSSYVVTTLMAAPASSALTTLANVRDELQETSDKSNDGTLTRYIAEESAEIARLCNRVFGLATWRDEFRPQRGVWGEGVRGATNPLKLTRWPLATSAVGFTGNTHSNLLVDGIASTAGLASGMPVFGSGIAAGATISSVMPTSILLSAPTTATATAVALSAGLSVVETIAGVSTQLVAGTDFEIEMGSGLPGDEGPACLYRLNEQGNARTWPAAKIEVVYRAGYIPPDDTSTTGAQQLPLDLQSVCIRLVIGRVRSRGRDPMLRAQEQPALGRTEFWVGAAPGQAGPYPNELMSVLERYRTPVVA